MRVICHSFEKAAYIINVLYEKEMDLQEKCTEWGGKTKICFVLIYAVEDMHVCKTNLH